MKYKSKLGRVTKNRESTQVILPKAIQKILDVQIGDTIEWIVTAENNKFKVTIQKGEEE